VTKLLARVDFTEKFFNFKLPQQEVDLYSSYTGCMILGEEWIEKNREKLYAAYLSEEGWNELSSELEFSRIEELFSKAFELLGSREEIEPLKPELTNVHKSKSVRDIMTSAENAKAK